jgi:pimeloyl-ACP methyl ester carboxylesterase
MPPTKSPRCCAPLNEGRRILAFVSSTVFVFVHGAFCNSLAWARIVEELTLRGHRAIAVDLPGHGLDATIPEGYLGGQDLARLATEPSGMAGIGTEDDVARVTGVVRRAAKLGNVVLVGHSRGGLTLTAVANAVPDLISRLVYIAAVCCVGRTVSEYAQLPEHAESLLSDAEVLAVGNPVELGALRLNWHTSDPQHLELLRELLLAEGSLAELRTYLQCHQPDEALRIDEEATQARLETWGRIPRSYIRLTRDRAMPLALQDRLIRDADALTPDNPFDVHSVASSHVGFQLRPTETVDILDRLASL